MDIILLNKIMAIVYWEMEICNHSIKMGNFINLLQHLVVEDLLVR